MLGIKFTNDKELVEICPQVLFGEKKKLLEVQEAIREKEYLGFPVLISREWIRLDSDA